MYPVEILLTFYLFVRYHGFVPGLIIMLMYDLSSMSSLKIVNPYYDFSECLLHE